MVLIFGGLVNGGFLIVVGGVVVNDADLRISCGFLVRIGMGLVICNQ